TRLGRESPQITVTVCPGNTPGKSFGIFIPERSVPADVRLTFHRRHDGTAAIFTAFELRIDIGVVGFDTEILQPARANGNGLLVLQFPALQEAAVVTVDGGAIVEGVINGCRSLCQQAVRVA